MEGNKSTDLARLSVSESSRPHDASGASAAHDHSLPGGGRPIRGCLKSPSSATRTTTMAKKSVHFPGGNPFVPATCLISGEEVIPGHVLRSLTSLRLVPALPRAQLVPFVSATGQPWLIPVPTSAQRLIVPPQPVMVWSQRPRSPPPAHFRAQQVQHRPEPRLSEGPTGPLYR